MSSALDKLVSNLEEDKFLQMRKEWQGDEVSILTKKGVYPYEYVNSWEKFDEARLPGRSAFYSSLNEEGVNEENYLSAKEVWQRFGCENLGD